MRARPRELLADLRAGRDPAQERKRRAGLTLQRALPLFLEARGADLGDRRSVEGWRRSLELHILPRLGERKVDSIALADVHGALAPLWKDHPDLAKRVRQRLERVLDWCAAAGHREGENPARWRGGLSELLAAPGRLHRVRPMPRIATVDLPAWWASLGDAPADDVLRLIALCACRSGEARGALGEEFDLAAATWTIPASRTKRRKVHRVPLSGPAVALVERLPRQGPVVPKMDAAALTRRMRQITAGRFLDPDSGDPAVPHGLRASFSSWAASACVSYDLAELSLAHAVGSSVARAYQRDDLLERRRPVMERWAAALIGQPGQVVTLRA